MSLSLSGPESIFAALVALNLNAGSWKVQFDGGKQENAITDYGHGASGTVAWMRFTVVQDGSPFVVEGEWDVASNRQTIKIGGSAVDLVVIDQQPYNGKNFIEPGVDGPQGSHVWLRYGVANPAGNITKEFRFITPLHADLGKIGDILKLFTIV